MLTRVPPASAAAGPTALPDCRAGPMPPTSRRRVALPETYKARPSSSRPSFLSLSSSLTSARLSTLSPPSSLPQPHVHADRPDCRRRAVFVPLGHSPPLGELHNALSPIPFGPRLTFLIPSSSSRNRRCPPQPPELRYRLGTPPHRAVFSTPQPSAVSGENPAAPPCSAQQPSLPRGVLVGRATPRPPVKPRHRTVTAPSARTQCLLEWAG
jgi:hypothetical protein